MLGQVFSYSMLTNPEVWEFTWLQNDTALCLCLSGSSSLQIFYWIYSGSCLSKNNWITLNNLLFMKGAAADYFVSGAVGLCPPLPRLGCFFLSLWGWALGLHLVCAGQKAGAAWTGRTYYKSLLQTHTAHTGSWGTEIGVRQIQQEIDRQHISQNQI